MSPLAVSSFNPMLRTVSIMPGMENLAPDRHDTSSGRLGSPNCLPVRGPRPEAPAPDPTGRREGVPTVEIGKQAWVVMVKPGGTGIPSRVISARFAPLPPSSPRTASQPPSTAVRPRPSGRIGEPMSLAVMIICSLPAGRGRRPAGCWCVDRDVGSVCGGLGAGSSSTWSRTAAGRHVRRRLADAEQDLRPDARPPAPRAAAAGSCRTSTGWENRLTTWSSRVASSHSRSRASPARSQASGSSVAVPITSRHWSSPESAPGASVPTARRSLATGCTALGGGLGEGAGATPSLRVLC